MEVQQDISKNKLRSLVGSNQHVVVDGFDHEYAVARTFRSAPDVDGVVYLKNPEGLMVGDRLDVKIISSDSYNLFAGPIDD